MGGDDAKTPPSRENDATMLSLVRDQHGKAREKERVSFETVDGQKIALYGVREVRCAVELENAFDYRRRWDLEEHEIEYVKRRLYLYASAPSARVAIQRIKGDFLASGYLELAPCFTDPSASCFVSPAREHWRPMTLEIGTVALERMLIDPADVVRDTIGWRYQGHEVMP